MQISILSNRVRSAVEHFWGKRAAQAAAQLARGGSDQGARSAVTGGAQMDGFIDLVIELVRIGGISDPNIYRQKSLVELPGFFRATKNWDLLVVADNQLILALESKSQVGSFGNNFNNRCEEAMGSALDFWTAYRENAFGPLRPWLGYLFLLEDCSDCHRPVRLREPHFPVLPEFRGTTYAERYQLFCQKLVKERHYDAACFLMSGKQAGITGEYLEPSPELNFEQFARSLVAGVSRFAK